MNSVPARAVEVSIRAITFLDTKLVEPIAIKWVADAQETVSLLSLF
jgi:hypothetical protein